MNWKKKIMFLIIYFNKKICSNHSDKNVVSFDIMNVPRTGNTEKTWPFYLYEMPFYNFAVKHFLQNVITMKDLRKALHLYVNGTAIFEEPVNVNTMNRKSAYYKNKCMYPTIVCTHTHRYKKHWATIITLEKRQVPLIS